MVILSASDRKALIRLASFLPKGSSDRRALLRKLVDDKVYAEKILEQLIDNWVVGFMDILSGSGSEGSFNKVIMGQYSKAAKEIPRRRWDLLAKTISSSWKKLFTPASIKAIALSVKEAALQEVEETKHMLIVASKIANGQKVPPQEVRAAAMQFIGIISLVLIEFVSPYLTPFIARGALIELSPIVDDVVGIFLDQAIKMSSAKFFDLSVRLLPEQV